MGWTAFWRLATVRAAVKPVLRTTSASPTAYYYAVQCMTRASTSGSRSSESPNSISSSERKARPSTLHLHGQGSSGARSAAVRVSTQPNLSPSRSANPPVGALRPPPRIRTPSQTPPRTTSTASEAPPMMSSTQTVTSTATESGLRVANSDAYRYVPTLYLPERTTTYSISNPPRRNALFVSATAAGPYTTPSVSVSGSGSASHDSEHATGRASIHDRDTYPYSHSQTYSQPQTNIDDDVQSQMQARTNSHSQSTWNTTITEIPTSSVGATAAAEANSGSPQSGYGSAAPSDSIVPAGFSPNMSSPPAHGHVSYYSGYSGPVTASGSAGPSGFRPPSLASYALTATAPETQPSLWRETVGAFSSTPWSQASNALRDFESGNQRAAQWDVTASSVDASQALQGASPTHSNSPESTTGVSSSLWAPASAATIEAAASTRSRSARTYTNTILSPSASAPSARPSLTRSAFVSPFSSSSSSLQVSSGGGSGTSSTTAPTSASTAVAAASRVPGPATQFSLDPYPRISPGSPSRLSGIVGELSTPFRSFVPRHTQSRSVAEDTTLSPSSPGGRQQWVHPSSPYGSETHSQISSRLPYSVASPGHERQHHDQAAAFQAPPPPQDRYAEHTSVGIGVEQGVSSSSSSGATASGPSDSRGADYLYASTNTGGYSVPFGVTSDSNPGPSSLSARSSGPLFTVPVRITAAESYDYPYPFPSSVPAPASVSASEIPSGSEVSTNPNTRKRNHPCWMCHKRFDRPSTLRKHLLVHTGEKAYVCDICGRRFGVASNLNRHYKRCKARPVNSGAFPTASTSGSASSSVPGPSTSSTTLSTFGTDEAMAREQTNPDVRRSERERDGREVAREDDQEQLPPAPAMPSAAEASSSTPRGRRRGRSSVETPLDTQNIHSSSPSAETGASSSHQTSYQLGSAFDSGIGQASGSGQVAVATAGASTSIGAAEGERRPKRRRRAPSPSRWVPASLRNFSLSPVRQRTSTPLPPVSPGFDAATNTYEERDSYATIADENVDPSAGGESSSTGGSNPVRSRAERLRNFEYAPYHPCGWTGRLPGPAVMGNDVTNYTKSIGGGKSGSGGGRYSGGNTGGGLSFMFEFSVAAAG